MIWQSDPKHKNLVIYYDKTAKKTYTFGGYGCFISCICQIAGITPQEGLEKLEFDGAMLKWESIKNVGLEPIEKTGWDNAKALKYIEENGQCIARVDFDGSERTDDTHFVILIGNKKLLDPIDGKEKPTSSYSKYTGIRACKKVENMASKELNTCLADRKKFWEERDALLNLVGATDVANAEMVLRGKQSQLTDLTNKLGAAQAEQKNKEEIISRLRAELITKGDDIDTLTDRLDQSGNTIAQLGKEKGNLAIEVEQLKIQVETLKQSQLNQSITLSIADLFKMLWNQKVTIKKG